MSSTEWRVDGAARTHLEQVLALECDTPDASHWSRDVYEGIVSPLSGNRPVLRQMFVVLRGETLLGFSVGMHSGVTPVGEGELETVVVAASARRLGIGRALCQAVLNWCRQGGTAGVSLEVRSRSDGPIGLYHSLGFETVGRRPGYYLHPADDALLMRLPFES